MSCYSASGSLYSRFYFTLHLCIRFEAATDVDHVEPHDEFFFLFNPILMTFSSSVIAFLPLALSFQLSSASAALHSVRSTLLPSVLACSGISLTSSSLSYASVVACVKLRAVGSLSFLAKHRAVRNPSSKMWHHKSQFHGIGLSILWGRPNTWYCGGGPGILWETSRRLGRCRVG